MQSMRRARARAAEERVGSHRGASVGSYGRRRALLFGLLISCAGAADDSAETTVAVRDPSGAASDAGSDFAVDEAAARRRPEDAGACGLTFDQARAAHPDQRVCSTTVYRLETGYCTSWLPCADLL